VRTGKRQCACAHHQQSIPGHERANAIGAGKERANSRTQELQEQEKAGCVIPQSPLLRKRRKQHSEHDGSGAGEKKAGAQHQTRHSLLARKRLHCRTNLLRHASPAALALGLYPACSAQRRAPVVEARLGLCLARIKICLQIKQMTCGPKVACLHVESASCCAREGNAGSW